MDFRSLLQSMTSLSEAEGSRVNKGTYGTSHGKEDVRDQYGHKVGKIDKEADSKKDAPKKGRGRPKKGSDDSGEVKQYDTKSIGSIFGGGQKPKKEVGTVSKKHSLKEYMEASEQLKKFESVMEGMFGGGVDHSSVAANLAKLARVIKSVQTPEQFAVAQKYARRMKGTIMNHQHDKMGFGSGIKANMGVMRAVDADLKTKAAELGIEYNALEEEMSNQAPIQIKPASQTNTQVIQQGNKTLGTVTNPQLANQIKQSIGKGEMTLNPDEEQGMMEGKDQGKPGKNFAKIAKSAGKEYGSKAAGERVAGAVKAKLAKQGKLEEAKPDFLDVDKDSDKKESFKKAVKDKEAKKKVSESIILEGAMKDLMMCLIDDLNAGGQGYNIKPAVDLQDRQLATRVIDKTLAHDDRYRRLSHSLKSQLRDAALEEFGFTDFETSLEEADITPGKIDSIRQHTQHGLDAKPSKFVAVTPNQPKTPWSVDPIERGTQEVGAGARKAFDFIRGTQKESTFEGKDMKDIQLESWENQLNSLLTEGITVSSSQGQQGAPDSVSVTATDNDAQSLMSVLRNAGIGGFGAGEEQPEIGYGVVQGGEEDFDGTGTEPQPSPDVVGDDGDMLSMIKKMAGLSGGDAEVVAVGGDDAGQDYEDEEGSAQTLEPADAGEDDGKEELTGSEEEHDSEDKEETDEGNAFTGQLKKTPQGGNFKMGDKSYKDTSSIEEEHDHDEEETCNECGGAMYEGHDCGQEQVEENFSNDVGGDAMADTELMKLKALLTMGGDMHKMKRDQTVGNPTQVSMAESLAQWKRLSGIKK